MEDAEMLADVKAYDAAKARLEDDEDELIPLDVKENVALNAGEPELEEVRPRFQDVFGSFPLFDDLYLRMQAMNLDMVDEVLRDEEVALLRRYMEIERTPLPEALFVSALSQLWIFGMYELLRTWRQRVEEILRFVRAWNNLPPTQRKKYVLEKRRKIKKLSQHALQSPWQHYSRALRSPKFLRELENACDRSERAFRRIEALRVSLAKHEVPKAKGALALAPGYGRIDMTSGSIYWQIILQGNEVDLISRQTIAEQCRSISRSYLTLILPRQVQSQLAGFPRHSYGTKRVSVTLKDKRNVDGVVIAWDKQIVHIEGDQPPFNTREIVDVKSSPRRIRIPRSKEDLTLDRFGRKRVVAADHDEGDTAS